MRGRFGNHRLVTEMNAIEITDRDRGIPDEIRQPSDVSEYAHCGDVGSYRKGSSQTINPPETAETGLTSLSCGDWAPKEWRRRQ